MSSISNDQRIDAIAVDDTATLICVGKTARRSLTVRNVTGSDTVYLVADGDGTTADGFPLAAGEAYRYEMFSGPVYAICAAAETADVRFVEIG